jgi:succinylglutamate desuccinylase
VCITALTHGNEIAGAVVLDRILAAGLQPKRGTLSLGFVNLAAFARFDPANPTLSRFADEDFNRLWDTDLLDSTRRSSELERAREIRPFIETVDVLLDLHSMLWPSEPLILCGTTARGRTLAQAIGTPSLVVADAGHATGPRLIDYPHFVAANTRATAILVEAGQHWENATIATAQVAVAGLLRHLDLVSDDWLRVLDPATPVAKFPPRVAEVTHAITASSGQFQFEKTFRGGDIVAKAGTLIGHDGTTEVRTPHDHCLLVMPSLRPSRGHTVVRLARFI